MKWGSKGQLVYSALSQHSGRYEETLSISPDDFSARWKQAVGSSHSQTGQGGCLVILGEAERFLHAPSWCCARPTCPSLVHPYPHLWPLESAPVAPWLWAMERARVSALMCGCSGRPHGQAGAGPILHMATRTFKTYTRP